MEESITLLTKIKQTFDCEGQDVRAYSPLTLAYIGDGIYELVIRSIVVERANRSANDLHKKTTRYVKAPAQSAVIEALLPELTFTATADQLAWLAARAFTPPEAEQVSLSHLHQAKVSVREQAEIVVSVLRERGSLSFRELTADAGERLVVVARFLALLELFRERAVSFEQLTPLGELRVRWVAGDADDIEISAEFDAETDTQEGSDD